MGSLRISLRQLRLRCCRLDILRYLYHQQIHGSAAVAYGLFLLPDGDCEELGASYTFADMCSNCVVSQMAKKKL